MHASFKDVHVNPSLNAKLESIRSPLVFSYGSCISTRRAFIHDGKGICVRCDSSDGVLARVAGCFRGLDVRLFTENPRRDIPFHDFRGNVIGFSDTHGVMVDSFAMSMYKKRSAKVPEANNGETLENENTQIKNFGHALEKITMVIGLAIGASDNPCTIRPLIAAICFHQMFEGMGLGGCILRAEYKLKTKAIMSFFFATTTPFGIVLGIGLSSVYSESSPNSLIVVGLPNASFPGLLNYKAMVILLAVDFMGSKLQANMKLQVWAHMAVLLGAGIMALISKWA
ncbi:hypothetical protein DITRI_Ditri17bG0109500 [Diplodiscus trichospermus]